MLSLFPFLEFQRVTVAYDSSALPSLPELLKLFQYKISHTYIA